MTASPGILGLMLKREWLSPAATVGAAGAILLLGGIWGGLKALAGRAGGAARDS